KFKRLYYFFDFSVFYRCKYMWFKNRECVIIDFKCRKYDIDTKKFIFGVLPLKNNQLIVPFIDGFSPSSFLNF
ncbi:MAG: hypothetical protein ACOYMD_12880, partial [Paludibacter sp.]